MDPNSPMGPPSRSATMPSREPPPAAAYGEYDYPAATMSGDMPPRPNTAGSMRPPRARAAPGPVPNPGLMFPPPDPPNRVSYAPKDFLDTYYDSNDEPDMPDMPNFDAIPHTNGPVDEMGLEAPKPKLQSPGSPSSPGSGQYAAYSPGAGAGAGAGASAGGLGTSQSRSLGQGDAPNQFENAGFNFNIGGGDTSPAASGYGHSPNSYDQSGGYFPHEPAPAYTPGPPGPVPPGPGQQGFPYEKHQSPDVQQTPDTLPSHPTPFRPGHDQAAKPAPVRNYNNAPVPAQAPAAVAAPQPTTPDVKTPITHDELERLQQKARGNPSDQATQLLLAKKLVEATTVLIQDNSRLDPKTKAKAKEKYIQDAHKIVKKLSQAGYADAQFYLADCYGEGLLGLEADPKEAFNLYHSAAKAGHAQSAYRVAVCCEIGAEEGGGTKRDPFKAVQWYKRAASLGDTPAMYKMGMIHLKGLLGQARSPREGISWLKRAAERADEENPHALHELALMYQTASGNDSIVRDEAYASQLFHQAAELGYKFSQFRLGTAYEYGLMGCTPDNRMSIIWYTRAAAQGEHQSELALSGWYLTGSEGVLQQSDTEAYLWARKAAVAGLAKAEYAMGYFTEVGIGAAANLDDAKRWYWRAAGKNTLISHFSEFLLTLYLLAQGFPKARERLEDLKKGGGRMQKNNFSRAAVNKQSDGDCVLM
ncbi:Tetratricopeptide-like helical [Penicillium odoratum]|uniref:Tetratricopeptide-like helical n=1 Tax=Penicillium odoratum TaxID=1167516 RepID=UPI002548FB9D|nr:Tetratricopeptide-like helical [Penicillium odoratum]KAJ5772321.1 Tetratricopeptide-like helical [Penicillium odoratum]